MSAFDAKRTFGASRDPERRTVTISLRGRGTIAAGEPVLAAEKTMFVIPPDAL
jgi:hypothetical protein